MLARSLQICALSLALVLPVLAPSEVARAQAVDPPKINETHATLNWILGRWRMPVLCERSDGSTVEVEEAVVFRPAREDLNGRTLKATFFGIDVADAVHCSNLVDNNVKDRRGVIYLTFVSQGRSDIGLNNLRRTLADGELTYTITRGRLSVREIGQAANANVLDFSGSGGALNVTVVRRGSDPDKLLTRFALKQEKPLALRKLTFAITGDSLVPERGHYLEDASRTPGRRRGR